MVYLLDYYFSKFPQSPNTLGVFYLHPLPKKPKDERAPWFSSVPIGKNKLAQFVKEMCKEVNTSAKTNHSLRVTGVRSMFAAGVSEV